MVTEAGTSDEKNRGLVSRVVVALDGVDVSRHFGRSSEYAIYDISGGEITARVIIPNPGHEPDFLPHYFDCMDVDCVITGGISTRACKWFENMKIRIIAGITGKAEAAVKGLISGTLSPGKNLCEHLDEGQCSCELLRRYSNIIV